MFKIELNGNEVDQDQKYSKDNLKSRYLLSVYSGQPTTQSKWHYLGDWAKSY